MTHENRESECGCGGGMDRGFDKEAAKAIAAMDAQTILIDTKLGSEDLTKAKEKFHEVYGDDKAGILKAVSEAAYSLIENRLHPEYVAHPNEGTAVRLSNLARHFNTDIFELLKDRYTAPEQKIASVIIADIKEGHGEPLAQIRALKGYYGLPNELKRVSVDTTIEAMLEGGNYLVALSIAREDPPRHGLSNRRFQDAAAKGYERFITLLDGETGDSLKQDLTLRNIVWENLGMANYPGIKNIVDDAHQAVLSDAMRNYVHDGEYGKDDILALGKGLGFSRDQFSAIRSSVDHSFKTLNAGQARRKDILLGISI